MIVAADAFAAADGEVAALGRDFLDRAAAVLPPAKEMQVAPDGFDAWREAIRIIQAYEGWQSFGAFVTSAKPRIGPGIAERLAYAATVTAEAGAAARQTMVAARAHIRALIPPGTVMAFPTSPCVAPPVDLLAAALDPFRGRLMRLACISGLAGLPQVTIPAGNIEGYPAGLSLLGWAGGDEALLDLAGELARFCGIAWSTAQ